MLFQALIHVLTLALPLAAAKIVTTDSLNNATTAAHSCEFYDSTCLNDQGSNPANCSGVKQCDTQTDLCFVVWRPSQTDRAQDANDTAGSATNTTTAPRDSGGKRGVTAGGHPSGHEVLRMGCIDDTHGSQFDRDCHATEKHQAGNLYHCYCHGFMCNQKFTFEAEPPPPLPEVKEADDPPQNMTVSVPSKKSQQDHSGENVAIGVAVVIVVLVIVGAVAFVRHRRKGNRHNSIPIDDFGDPLGGMPPGAGGEGGGGAGAAGVDSLEMNKPIDLLEIWARGKFGAVWRGRWKPLNGDPPRIVAVKIFPLQDKASWKAEQDIYKLPRMDHANILKFLGVESRGENSMEREYWLTSEFHERGSLCDFLKSNVVSWDDLCKIALSMARGLTHLHEEIPEQPGLNVDMKPAIAHRDFKSKNVLIKSDMTACIADFGLALIFEPGKSCGDTHGQVGTRRYMAPEVLEGAINFSRDAFLRIDMYACGLVLWELASRCTVNSTSLPPPLSLPAPTTPQQQQNGPINLSGSGGGGVSRFTPNQPTPSSIGVHPINPSRDPEYKLPFEAEVASPSLEQMRDLVVNQKARPLIKGHWRSHPGMAALCDTIEECWDQDAEARLSASCVKERIVSFQALNPVLAAQQQLPVAAAAAAANAVADSNLTAAPPPPPAVDPPPPLYSVTPSAATPVTPAVSIPVTSAASIPMTSSASIPVTSQEVEYMNALNSSRSIAAAEIAAVASPYHTHHNHDEHPESMPLLIVNQPPPTCHQVTSPSSLVTSEVAAASSPQLPLLSNHQHSNSRENTNASGIMEQ